MGEDDPFEVFQMDVLAVLIPYRMLVAVLHNPVEGEDGQTVTLQADGNAAHTFHAAGQTYDCSSGHGCVADGEEETLF